MRIERTRGAGPVNKSDKAKKSSSSGGAFGAFLEGDTGATQGAAPAMGAGGVGALLAAQYEDEGVLERQKRKQMVKRAHHVLDALDEVKNGLVRGNLSVSELNRLKNSLAVRREQIEDPRLIEIMDEVEMRAQIELAKLEMAKKL